MLTTQYKPVQRRVHETESACWAAGWIRGRFGVGMTPGEAARGGCKLPGCYLVGWHEGCGEYLESKAS